GIATDSAGSGAPANRWSSSRVLKTRLISAVIMIPLVVFGVLYASTTTFQLVLAAILLAGAWEWGRLAGLTAPLTRAVYVAVVGGMLLLSHAAGLQAIAWPVLLVACLWWLCALVWLTRPRACAGSSTACMLVKLLAGLLVCVPAWAVLGLMHGTAEDGPVLVLVLLVMVWLADSGAYFAGRFLGRHKLAPVVSPGKTWEGVFGGLLASVLFAAGTGWLLFAADLPWIVKFMLATLVAMMFSIVGDLFVSLLKRQSGLKDSGNIIPGHGGIFDRIDSLVAAAPLFLAGYRWLEL
ncbi:MAG: phosphatidate cytidylyltransferase, partial [Thiohalobacterales bacterium]|nr:phosphatidate cytidylyltransferase [Thiohalobacterales bacterium]